MKQDQLSKLLGRPLTPTEVSSFDLYLKIAQQSLEDLMCTVLCNQDDPKFYETRVGYSTVFTDIFTDLDEVKIDGKVIDQSKYSIRQWDRRNASWYNSIVFNKRFCKNEEIEVSATWGFKPMPVDLQAVLAGLFDLVTKKNKFDGTVKSKRVEDFHISLNTDVDFDSEFANKYGNTIRKYSLCDVGNIQHGKVHHRWNLYC